MAAHILSYITTIEVEDLTSALVKAGAVKMLITALMPPMPLKARHRSYVVCCLYYVLHDWHLCF